MKLFSSCLFEKSFLCLSLLVLPCRCSPWRVPPSASLPHISLGAPSHLGYPSTRS